MTLRKWSPMRSFLAAAVSLTASCAVLPTPTPTPALAPFAAEAIQALCYWPAGTVLSFRGWATLAELGGADRNGRLGSDHVVFAIVSRDRISQPSHGGAIVARGMCIADEQSWGTSAVPDDWQPPVGR